jgi:septal ring factor EnvC (AmiA/AmiB activator)
MIDNMVTELSAEQKDDEAQKAFCDKDLEKSEASKAQLTDQLASSEATIEEAKEASASAADEIASLQTEIKNLDKAVADATEQRKGEHADFTQFSAENNAAIQLIEKAKNKLFKFYKPNLHKEEAPKEEEAVFVQLAKGDAAPPPPPDTWGAYQKKDRKSNGVISLMENLAKELQDDSTQAKHDEDTSQSEYERLMADSQASRQQCVEGITAKESAKADLDEKVEATKELKRSQEAEKMNVEGYIAQLHANCDFLVQNFDLRKAARTNEIESLQNAKAVLSGADFK